MNFFEINPTNDDREVAVAALRFCVDGGPYPTMDNVGYFRAPYVAECLERCLPDFTAEGRQVARRVIGTIREALATRG